MGNQKYTLSYTESKELKHKLLNDGTFKKYKAYRKKCNQLKLLYSIDEIDDTTGQLYKVPTFEYYEIIKQLENQLINEISPFGFHHCQQIENNGYNRVQRLRARIKTILENENPAYFITFTFTDEYINKLNDKSKRVIVSRVLKNKCSNYVANVDYGGDSEYIDNKGQLRKATARIHFHAVADAPIDKTDWPYGWMTCIKVRDETEQEKLDSIGRIPPYLDKLTKHAKKRSTNGLTPIYSRKKGVKYE